MYNIFVCVCCDWLFNAQKQAKVAKAEINLPFLLMSTSKFGNIKKTRSWSHVYIPEEASN